MENMCIVMETFVGQLWSNNRSVCESLSGAVVNKIQAPYRVLCRPKRDHFKVGKILWFTESEVALMSHSVDSRLYYPSTSWRKLGILM